MRKKILVTGGAGYIGSHVVKLLGKKGFDVVVLDNLSTGREESVLFGELVNMDLKDVDGVRTLFSRHKFDGVMHFAGSIIVPESVTDPIKYYKNNTENSLNLIKICEEKGVNNFIFSSTAAVYGYPDNGICYEGNDLKPITPYGKSKLMTEWMLEGVANSNSKFNYVALRYFNVAGADVDCRIGQCSPDATHLIKVASEVVTGKRSFMHIYGNDYETADGTCIRDYIHVEDLAQAHLDSLNYLFEYETSQILNCGYGRGHSVNEVIKCVREVSGNSLSANIAPRRDGDAPMLIANSDKLRGLTGWTPKFDSLELIVKTALDWEFCLKEKNKTQ